ncbi:GBF-interacting protein 1-like isoform X2 [Magnolia sinica]|uniref:GBF-interacting protein 1-like isoform X2 n=1 Tax=Magnolia sinica TaxID=86752 RepID=UPI00265B268E|nr:GBF-interacting protein 1-like isoform X2 [Magnolia sinica]
MSGGVRVSIPNNVRKMVQDIKEIAGNHTDEEIYAMLKECSMDPNETAQNLLLQDPFHEVKRKRDRRKENPSNREPAETIRWRPGMQGRGGRGARGSYSSRYSSYDVGSGRNANTGKDNGVNQSTDRGLTSTSSPVLQYTENKATIPTMSPITGMENGPTNVAHGNSTHGSESLVPGGSGVLAPKESSAADANKTGNAPLSPADVKSSSVSVIGGEREQFLSPTIPVSASGVYSSASDPVLVPSLDSRIPGVVGTIKREVGSRRTAVEPTVTVPAESKTVSQDFTDPLQIDKIVPCDSAGPESVDENASSEMGNPFMDGKMPSKSQGVERNQLSEAPQALSSSSLTGSSGSRPSSNYGSRSQPLTGPQKAPSKEWKPKPTNPNIIQPSSTIGTSDVAPITAEASARSLPASSSTASASEETASKLQTKLEELHFSNSRHVIIPNHLLVPEAERTGLSFGSFDASFVLGTSFANGPDSDKISTSVSESSQGIEETVEEPSSSMQNPSATTQEGDYSDHSQSPDQMQENLSPAEADVPSSISPTADYDQSKPESALSSGGPQYSVVHATPNYSTFGLMPPMLGNQFTPFESSEPQARDATRLPSIVVQQPFDPSTSYYTQLYRPGADSDGRFSPFPAPGATTKYNGNIGALPSQTGQSPPENGSSLVLSTAGPTLVTQAAGVMQSSIAATQQPVPVFRQPTGVHISHYPPNYLPYSQYFPPYYVPPTAIHHFLGNTAFPQQSLTGSIYPPPTAAAAGAAAAIKYSLSQYKPGTNTSNSAHIGMPTGYGPYSSGPAGYSASPAVTAGNSTGNEDLAAAPQYKENNVYISGQQSEGSAVWIPAPSRDIPGLQPSSFYNLPQGQHMAFAAAQAGHGTFAGIYHPAQAVPAATVHPLLQQPQTMAGSVEMVGPPPAGVYQQPQQSPQINWANNY